MSGGPQNAQLNGEGFRFYRWTDAITGETHDLLSVTSIRRLLGTPYVLLNWNIGNVIDTVMGTVKRPAIGKRGKPLKSGNVYHVESFPSQFAERYMKTDGKQGSMDELRKWLRETADQPLNIAGRRGTIVHAAIEKNIQTRRIERAWVEAEFENLSARDRAKAKDGVKDEDVAFIRSAVANYWDMRANVPFVIIAREPQVFNLTMGYGGSADALAWFLPEGFDEKLPKAHEITLKLMQSIGGYAAVGDWKTSKGVYCHTGDTLVLTDDLRWVRADSLREGDGLWAFTEDRVPFGRKGRRWRLSTVTRADRSWTQVIRVTMASGRSLVSTLDHPYLARRSSGGRRLIEGGTIWLQAQDLRIGDTLPRYLTPWTEDESREAGWFAGLLDGEGSLSGHRLSFAQKEGPVSERARSFMRNANISWSEYAGQGAIQFAIRGDVRDIAAILGRIRPSRLLSKFAPGDLQAAQDQHDRIVDIQRLGAAEVVNLSTTSGTYFANGYGSHNTDQVVQVHAYGASEFVGADGIVNHRLTDILQATQRGVLFHIRPEYWGVHIFDFSDPVFRAFAGSVAFARFLAEYPRAEPLFISNYKGSAPKETE